MFNKTIELNLKYNNAYLNKQISYGLLNKKLEALYCFESALEMNPDFSEAYLNIK